MNNEILIENSVFGSIYSNPIYPKVFRANLFNGTYQSLLGVLIIKALVSLYFAICFFYYSLIKTKHNVRNLKYMHSFRGLFDLAMIFLSFISLGFGYQVKSDEKSILDNNEYFDFHDISESFNLAIIFNSWSSLFIIFRLLSSLTLNRSLFLIKLNIEIAGKNILYYLVMLQPIMISFVFVSWTVWGPYFFAFRRFGLSLVNNLLFTIGNGNSNLQIQINLFWTITFYLLFWIFSVFIVICGFIGLYMDAYREVKAKEGYRDDMKAWVFLDYLVWVLGCFNKKKIRHKFEELIKKRKEAKAEKMEREEKEKAGKLEKSEFDLKGSRSFREKKGDTE